MKKLFFLSITIFFSSIAVFGQARVAVLSTIGDVEEDIRGLVQDALERGVNNSANYSLVGRGAAFEAALSELAFQASGAVDDDQLKEFGRAVGADYACYANIRAIVNSFRITYRLIDVTTAEISEVNSKTVPNDINAFFIVLDEISNELFGNEGNRNANIERQTVAMNDQEVETVQKLNDEKAWELALQTKTIDAYHAYLVSSSSPIYLEQAKVWLEDAYFTEIRDAAISGEINKMNDLYRRFMLIEFDGRLDATIHNIRCDAYYTQAMRMSQGNNASEIARANDYLHVVKRMCPAIRNVDSQISRNNSQIQRLMRR